MEKPVVLLHRKIVSIEMSLVEAILRWDQRGEKVVLDSQ
jgi:hypothetical protein